MNTTLISDFSVDKENKTITIKREFAAKRPLVWDAFTKSEMLDQWWAPKPWKARTKAMDFKEGGKWIYAMVGPHGEEHWSFVKYNTIEPQQKFTGLDGFSDANGNVDENMPQSKWEVKFIDRGDTTEVDYHISFDDASHLDKILEMGFKEGIESAMEGLDELLASGQK
jgi:uncharacterized protein YndB with AHSA1/START domain